MSDLHAKGLTSTIIRRWKIADLSLWFDPDLHVMTDGIVSGWVQCTESNAGGEPLIEWEWLDEDGDPLAWESRRDVLKWMDELLAPAIESNYLAVVLSNELMRGVTTEEARANGAPF